jgi:hypothetical protein
LRWVCGFPHLDPDRIKVRYDPAGSPRERRPTTSRRAVLQVGDDRPRAALAQMRWRGGATAAGAGLAGLADRLAAFGWTFAVESRDGGGTIVRAELPCAS